VCNSTPPALFWAVSGAYSTYKFDSGLAQWDIGYLAITSNRKKVCQRGRVGCGEGSTADRNRRFTLAAIALPLLLIAMSGLACAHDFVVTTLSGAGALSPLCSLSDAVTAHNSHSIVGGCGQGSSNDRIFFAVTGKILIKASLEIMSGTLSINGPLFGCSGPGPCGITIDGGNTVQIIHADLNTSVSLTALTLAHGRGVTSAVNTGGGAIFTFGNNLTINDCLFVNNQAVGFTSSFGVSNKKDR